METALEENSAGNRVNVALEEGGDQAPKKGWE